MCQWSFSQVLSESLHFTLERKQPSWVDESHARSNLLSCFPHVAGTSTLILSTLILSWLLLYQIARNGALDNDIMCIDRHSH